MVGGRLMRVRFEKSREEMQLHVASWVDATACSSVLYSVLYAKAKVRLFWNWRREFLDSRRPSSAAQTYVLSHFPRIPSRLCVGLVHRFLP